MALHEIVLKVLMDGDAADAAYKYAAAATAALGASGTVLDWDFEENEIDLSDVQVYWNVENAELYRYYPRSER